MLLAPDNPLLSQVTEPITSWGDEEERWLAEMVRAMSERGGLAIAAPQIGWSAQVFLANPELVPGIERVLWVNPQIVSAEGRTRSEEGCLSLPGQRLTLNRYRRIKVRVVDKYQLRSYTYELEGLPAVVVQHEYDHLNGILISHRRKLGKDKEFKQQGKEGLGSPS